MALTSLTGASLWKTIPNNTKSSWWMDPALRINMMHCIGLCGTLFFNGYDGSLFNGLQTIDAWQDFFGHPTSNKLGIMNASAYLPGCFGALLADQVGNRFGRRWAVWLGTLICLAGTIINASAINLGQYIAGRAVLGFGTNVALTVAPTLLQEIAHPRYRARISGFYTCIYYIAAICSSSICLGTRNLSGNHSWRIPCYLQAVAPIATILLTLTLPESPRWLVKHGKEEKARDILVKHHANNKEDDELVAYEYNEIMKALAEEELNSETKYMDYFKTPANRHRLFLLLVISIGTNWVGNGIISYYLSPILETIGVSSTRQQAVLNVGLQVWNLVLSTGAALMIDFVGRRPLWLSSTLGMMFSFCIVMGLSARYAQDSSNKAVGTAVIPFLFIFFGFYDIAWTPLAYSYPVEILPFSLRVKGQVIFITAQTLAASLNTFINPIILAHIQWKSYSIYIAILAVLSTIIYFTFPETKNLTIEEISVVFEGDDAANALDRLRATEAGNKTAIEHVEDPATGESVHIQGKDD